MTMQKHSVNGFIFDLDGTLVRSRLNFAWLRQQLDCPGDQDLLTYVDNLNSHEKAHAQKVIENHEWEDAQQAPLLAGALTLLQQLPQERTAIVTRNCRAAAREKLRHNDIKVDQLLTREDAIPKPAPDALLQVAERWQLHPESCIYIGDYRYDVEAANRAGMVSCLLVEEDEELPEYHHQADIVIRRLDHLLEHLGDPV